MGSVNTSIQLYDGASGTLQKITNAVSRTVQRFDDMNDHFDGAFDEGAFNSAKNGFNNINILINKIENNIDRSTTNQQAFTQQVNKSTAAENEMLSRMKSIDNSVKGINNGIKQSTAQQEKFNSSINAGSNAGNNLLSKIKTIAATYLGLQAVKNVLNASDELTQTTARLNIMNDGFQTTAQLSQKIFESAERARGSYTDTAAVISRLGIMAGKAFKSNDEIIAFTELMNKNFKIGGASATEQTAAMYQLSQAMASGRLQGDEYRSIIENAPLLAKSIEDYMINVQKAKGSMKDWSSKGLLTANVIKAAMFRSADETEERFKKIPMTWSDVMTSIKNNALMAFQPALKKINEIANSEKFQNFKNNLINSFKTMSIAAMELFNSIVNIVNFFSENWGIISPIIWGIVTAMVAYNAVSLITNGILAAQALAEGINGAAKAFSTGATFAATVAQYGLNAALLACPLVWITLLIIGLVAVFYAVIGAVNHFAGTSISATGVIAGAFLVLVSVIGNTVIGLLNGLIQAIWSIFVEPFLGIIEWVLNVTNGGFDSFGGAVANLIGQIISWFLSLGKVVTKIIDAIFGTNWTGGLESLQDKVLSWGKNDKAITIDRNAPGIEHRFDYGDAWKKGNDWGKGVDNSLKNLLKSQDDESNKRDDKNDYSKLYNDVGKTADNTGKMAKSVKISDEDLKYLHDVAEREAINRFTTAEIKVDMTNHNNISGTRDIDGIVEYLRNEVEEQMSRSAEGVS
ncbi:tape measure protein [Anaerocolumna jejuensis]|uniref:tape measure protein n=1 Tax=Anaerocolumna jejuensis TaxID=259063 RepID=UPI003F7C53EC